MKEKLITFDRRSIAVVLVGTDRLDAVVKRDEQIHNCFRACYQFGKLSGDEFKQTIDIWERQVLKLPVASNLSSPKMMKILGQTTRGYLSFCGLL